MALAIICPKCAGVNTIWYCRQEYKSWRMTATTNPKGKEVIVFDPQHRTEKVTTFATCFKDDCGWTSQEPVKPAMVVREVTE